MGGSTGGIVGGENGIVVISGRSYFWQCSRSCGWCAIVLMKVFIVDRQHMGLDVAMG